MKNDKIGPVKNYLQGWIKTNVESFEEGRFVLVRLQPKLCPEILECSCEALAKTVSMIYIGFEGKNGENLSIAIGKNGSVNSSILLMYIIVVFPVNYQ